MSIEEFESFDCPYCGEPNDLAVDPTGGARQTMIVDCTVCCAPIIIHVRIQGSYITIDVEKENE